MGRRGLRYLDKLFGDGGDFCCMPLSSARQWGGFETGGALPGDSDYHHFVNAAGLLSFHHGLEAPIVRISGFKATIHKTSDDTLVVNYHEGATSYASIVRKTGTLPKHTVFGDLEWNICFVNTQTDWIVFDARQEGAEATGRKSDVLLLKLPCGHVQLGTAMKAPRRASGRRLEKLGFSSVGLCP